MAISFRISAATEDASDQHEIFGFRLTSLPETQLISREGQQEQDDFRARKVLEVLVWASGVEQELVARVEITVWFGLGWSTCLITLKSKEPSRPIACSIYADLAMAVLPHSLVC